MKVLLINLISKPYNKPIVPLGMLYVGNALHKYGIEFDFFDMNFYLDPYFYLINKVKEFQPDLAGLSIRNIAETPRMNGIYVDIIKTIKTVQRYCKVVLGGAGFSIFATEILNLTGAEFGIVGEGEAAIVELIQNLPNYPLGSLISKNESSFVKSDISTVLKKYWNIYGKYYKIDGPIIPVQTTRGCCYKCSYCVYPFLFNSENLIQRPIDLVVTEIKNIIDNIDVRTFYFVDSVFNADLNYTKALLRLIVNKGLNIKWYACMNPAYYDNELIVLMIKAGCIHIDIGIDSFSNERLSRLKKPFNAQQSKELISKIEEYNLSFGISLVLCGFGETMESLNETISVANSYKATTITAFLGERIYPGTDLYDQIYRESKESLLTANEKSIFVEPITKEAFVREMKKGCFDKWYITNYEMGGANNEG